MIHRCMSRFAPQPAFGIIPFVLQNDAGTPSGLSELWYVTESPGQDPTFLLAEDTSLLGDFWNPVQSPDDTTIAIGDTDSGFNGTLGVVPLGGGAATVIDTRGFLETFSFWHPDGSHLLVVVNAGDSNARGDIYRINADGSGATLIDAPAGTNTGWSRPQYNRDGTLVAAVLVTPLGDGDLYVMEPDGSNQTLIVTGIGYGSHGSQYGWANGSDVLAYADQLSGGVWRIDADGTNKSRISTSTSALVKCGKWCWTPDDAIVIASFGGAGAGVVKAVPADGSGETILDATAPNLGQSTPPLIFGDRVYYFRSSAGLIVALTSIALDGSGHRDEHVLTVDQFVNDDYGLEVA